MSDDMWGSSGSLFDDDERRRRADERTDENPEATGLSCGDESGPLPHWTEPPTGEIPRPDDLTVTARHDTIGPGDGFDELDLDTGQFALRAQGVLLRHQSDAVAGQHQPLDGVEQRQGLTENADLA